MHSNVKDCLLHVNQVLPLAFIFLSAQHILHDLKTSKNTAITPRGLGIVFLVTGKLVALSSWRTSCIELKVPCQQPCIKSPKGIFSTSGNWFSAYSCLTRNIRSSDSESSSCGCLPVMTSYIAQPKAKISVFRLIASGDSLQLNHS